MSDGSQMFSYSLPVGVPIGGPVIYDDTTLFYTCESTTNGVSSAYLVCLDYTTGDVQWTYPPETSSVAAPEGLSPTGGPACTVPPVLVGEDKVLVCFNVYTSDFDGTSLELLNVADGSQVATENFRTPITGPPVAAAFNFGDAIVLHSSSEIWLWLPDGLNDDGGSAEPTVTSATIPTRIPGHDTVSIGSLIAWPTWIAYSYQDNGTWHLARVNLKRHKNGVTHEHEGMLDITLDEGLSVTGINFFANGYRVYAAIAGGSDGGSEITTFPCSEVYSDPDKFPMPVVGLSGPPIGAPIGFEAGGSAPNDQASLCIMLESGQLAVISVDGAATPDTTYMGSMVGAPASGVAWMGQGTGIVFVPGCVQDQQDAMALYWLKLTDSDPSFTAMRPFEGQAIVGSPCIAAGTLGIGLQSTTDGTGSIFLARLEELVGSTAK